MQITWTKYTYVCDPDECDSLVEYTCGDTFGFPSGDVRNFTCPCGRNMQLVSVEPATIPPTTTKEGQMETTTNYDANILVTYKDIVDGVATYPTLKVNELEWKLERIKRLEQQLEISNGQIRQIIDNLSEDGWYNPNYEKEEVLNDLCEILDYEPKKEISFEGRVYFSGRVDIKLSELEDFDLEDMLSELSLDVYNGDVVIDDYSVEDVREC
jgi:hypothetical protein